MTRPNVALHRSGERNLQPAVVASLAALFLLRGFLLPTASVAGHFSYGSIDALGGRIMLATAVAAGAGGAVVGTVFHKFVSGLKKALWRNSKQTVRRQVIVKTLVGFLVGCLALLYPQIMFWGEGSLQAMVDGQKTAFTSTRHGLSSIISKFALVDPSIPFQSWKCGAQIGLAKLFAIGLTGAGKFPGGIIFPLFYAAAPLAHAACGLVPGGQVVTPVAVMCLMAATQASATRTPLASSLILGLTASAGSDLSVLLPASLVASYVSVYLSRMLSRNAYFEYAE